MIDALVKNLHFLTMLSISVFWIWGFYCIFNTKFLLGWVHAWLEHFTNHKVMKPLMSCPPCMSSLHGAFLYWGLFDQFNLLQFVFFIVLLTGINFLIKEFIYQEVEEDIQIIDLPEVDEEILKEAKVYADMKIIDPDLADQQKIIIELLQYYRKSKRV
jgi:hypothetical protein